jgi:hypothetical protein
MGRGLGGATEVMAVADCFSQAKQRLDRWRALEHLWVVAHALYPEDETAAAAWL